MRAQSFARLIAFGAASTLLTTGCLGGGGGTGGGGDAGGDGEVEIMYGFANEQSDAFQEKVSAWAEEEGINVKFAATPDFDKLIRSRVAGNNIPDIAIFPQPGILMDIAEGGDIADLRDVVDTDALQESMVPGILDASTAEDGAIYGAPMSISVKSLVWYPKPEFEEAGYEVPQTHEELLALTEQIKADGTAPWCVGIESGPATGWVATDWVEDYVLRVGGTEGYDKWVNHEIPFDDPMVQEAAGYVEEIWMTEGNVLGGSESIASNAFATAANPMFDEEPSCFLHRQASFLALPGSFPDEVIADLDNQVGVFQLPGIEEGPAPVLGGGDVAALFSEDDPEAVAVMEYITGEEFTGWVETSGYISPHTTFDVSLQPNETMRDISEIAYSAENFRFDGSDLMPGEVGAGSFWREMTAWTNGAKPIEDALTAIEESWPAS